jgi:Fe-S oxidoreductase
MLSVCPHCVRTIGVDWQEYGANIPIEHHSAFLARHAARIPGVRDGQKKKAVYHDPCYLGRYAGLYDEPRQIAARAGELVEPPRSRERSFCCGAGGGLVFLGEEKGKRVSVERAEELSATEAEIIIAACPFCYTMFRDALPAAAAAAPKLFDIAEIAAAGLQRANGTPGIDGMGAPDPDGD